MFRHRGKFVYAETSGEPVVIAEAESESWAETIANALNNDPDAYAV